MVPLRLVGPTLTTLALMGAACSACSSGRRQGSTAAPSVELPVLVTSDPADGETLVERERTVVATFSTDLQASSVAAGVVLLDAAGQPVPGTVVRLATPRTVEVDPLGALPGATDFALRVTPDLRSAAGASPPAPVEVRFRTRSAVRAGSLLLNEVYAGTNDANGLPGGNPALDEQFVELVNVTAEPLQLMGLTLATTARPKAHVFGPLLLPPGGAVVVWAQAPAGPGNVQASGADLAISLSTGDRVRLLSTELPLLEEVDLVAFPSPTVARPTTTESINRLVDAAVGDQPGGPWVRHSDAPGAVGLRSPGTRVSGIPFPGP